MLPILEVIRMADKAGMNSLKIYSPFWSAGRLRIKALAQNLGGIKSVEVSNAKEMG